MFLSLLLIICIFSLHQFLLTSITYSLLCCLPSFLSYSSLLLFFCPWFSPFSSSFTNWFSCAQRDLASTLTGTAGPREFPRLRWGHPVSWEVPDTARGPASHPLLKCPFQLLPPRARKARLERRFSLVTQWSAFWSMCLISIAVSSKYVVVSLPLIPTLLWVTFPLSFHSSSSYQVSLLLLLHHLSFVNFSLSHLPSVSPPPPMSYRCV